MRGGSGTILADPFGPSASAAVEETREPHRAHKGVVQDVMTDASTETASKTETAEQASLPRCRCGYDRDHHFVSPEPKHTFWGWVLITVGITSIPIWMGFRCRRCKALIEETTDPAVMKRYRG